VENRTRNSALSPTEAVQYSAKSSSEIFADTVKYEINPALHES